MGFRIPLPDVHSRHRCTCTAASPEDLGGPWWTAMSGQVCGRRAARAVNDPSTSAKHIFSDTSQHFYLKSFSQTAWVGATCQGRMDLKVEANLTNAEEPMLRHKSTPHL